MTEHTYAITMDGTERYAHSDTVSPLIGFTVKSTGSKSSQNADIILSNIDGNLWTADFPAFADVQIEINDTRVFDGFIDGLSVSEGSPGEIRVGCIGHSAELKYSAIRPLVYDSDEDAANRDGSGISVVVAGGRIQVPTDAEHSPIYEVISVKSGSDYVSVLNIDRDLGIIYVDRAYDGDTLTLNYTVFEDRYEDVAASSIITELFNRHAIPHMTSATIVTIASTITFEPTIGSSLLDAIREIIKTVGGGYDFYVDANHVLQLFARSGTSVKTYNGQERSASFSVDNEAYANVVTVVAGAGKTNSISQTSGAFRNEVEGLTPTGIIVDAFAQGFKALDRELQSLKIKSLRETAEDAIDWEIQYNGKRGAIKEDHTASHSLTPDSTNMTIDAATDDVHVTANGVGTAYYSSDWFEDLNQDTGASTTTITGNIYQTITVSDLTNKTIKGIAIKSATAVASQTFHLEIYSGTSGNTGTLLGTSETTTMNATSEMETDWFAVYFAAAVDVSAQTNISIVAVMDSGAASWTRSTADPYAGGVASSGAGDDFTFQFFTFTSLSDFFASFFAKNDTVAVAAKAPLYYVARDYVIGSPTAANWVQVFSGSAVQFTDAAVVSNKLGIKVEFNSASLTTDPLLHSVQGSVAYTSPSVALDEPSNIVVGGLSGTIAADDLPFYNPETGSFTLDITATKDRLEPNGNYWLIGRDGNQDSSVSFFTVFYDDGASGTYTEDWDDSTAIDVESNLQVSGSEATTDPFTKIARMESTNIITTAGTITDGLIINTDKGSATRALSLLSRNKRNYYYPGRSTDTAKPALNTGEIGIWQFDTGDVGGGSPIRTVADQSGNGFSMAVHVSAPTASGKFGGGVINAGTGQSLGVTEIARWLAGDVGVAFWFNPTTSLVNDRYIFSLASPAATPLINLQIRTMASGAIKVVHSYNNGASTETATSTGTPLIVGTWTHIAVTRDMQTKTWNIYLDGVLDSSPTFAQIPDTPQTAVGGKDLVFLMSGLTGHTTATGTGDELRVWPRVTEDWTIALAKDRAYDAGQSTRFVFPVEADGTDDYTDSDSADAVKDDLRTIQFYWPAPYYNTDVILRCPFNYANINGASVGTFSDIDLSSYAHQIDTTLGSATTAPAIVTGGVIGEQADFDGTNDAVAVLNSTTLNSVLQGEWTLMWYHTQDVTGTTQTLFHRRGTLKIESKASSATLTDLTVIITAAGGVTRSAVFSGLSIGTARTHVAVAYDKQNVTVFVGGTQAGTFDHGSISVSAASTKSFCIGATNSNDTSAGRSAFFNGKLDEVILYKGELTAAQIAVIDSDPSIGLRAPIQTQYVAAAYVGTGTKAYADGKYLVSRDMDNDILESWVNTLDGSTANPNGSLCFEMVFGKSALRVTRRDQTEIDRVRFEVEKTFEVNATDIETLGSAAEGLLAVLKDGLDKGRLVIDGDETRQVGQIVTADYPAKGQASVQYAIATVEHRVTEGDFYTVLEIGEEERSMAALLAGLETGI